MSDGNIIETTAKVAGGGFGLGGGFFAFRWIVLWFTGRHDKRQAVLDAESGTIDQKWRAYRKAIEDRCEKLEGRCGSLEAEVEKCHSEKHDLESRVAYLEAHADARGEMRQQRQIDQSVMNIVDRAKSAD